MRALEPRRLIVRFLLLAAVATAGCGGGSGPSAARIVAESATATASVKSFHLVLTVDNVPAAKTGMSLTYLDGDLAVPKDLHAKIAGTLNGTPLNSELIVSGGSTFLKNPFTGKWTSVSVGTNPVAFFDPAKGVLAVIKGAVDVAKDGSEKVGGTDSYRLTANVRADAVAPLLGNARSARLLPVELWVGKQDMLLRRIRLSGPVAAGEPASAARTVELSAFGKPVQVEPPATS